MSESAKQVSILVVTYRDAQHWLAKHRPERSKEYEDNLCHIQLSEKDMQALGIDKGTMVTVSNSVGSVDVVAKQNENCPEGIGYMPISAYSNMLTEYDPEKSTLPNFKRLRVQVEPSSDEEY